MKLASNHVRLARVCAGGLSLSILADAIDGGVSMEGCLWAFGLWAFVFALVCFCTRDRTAVNPHCADPDSKPESN
jgi:hypothetical protein